MVRLRLGERVKRKPMIVASLVGTLFVSALLMSCGDRPSGPDAAQRLLTEGRREAAARALRGFEPQTNEDWNLLAKVYSGLRGFEDEAIAAFEPLGQSGEPGAALLAARVAAEVDRPRVGVEWLRAALQKNQDAREVAIELAKMLGRLERHREAVAVLEPRAGSDPRMLNLVGYAWLLAGDPERARAYLERSVSEALARGRDYAPPHHHLGLLLADEGRYEEALEEQLDAMAANPDHLGAHYQALAMAERVGDQKAAERARAGFARLYGPRLEAQGLLEDLDYQEAERIYRGVSWEARPEVSESVFTRTFPAGSEIEFACRVPLEGRALFEVSAEGAEPLHLLFEGDGREAFWHPHRFELPEGPGQVDVRFEVKAGGRLARLVGGDAPAGARFSEPALLPPARARSADARPNVLLISLDTLRAESIGSYGHERDTMPELGRLAARGVRFEHAQAPSNWTLPSHYSIFTGLTPAAHGVMPDLAETRGYINPNSQLNVRGSGLEVMLAESLRDVGYRTTAVTENGWVSAHFGFDQGFQIYRSAPAGSLPGTLSATLGELEATGERGPWFLFVHTYAPHQPYHAPAEFRLRWAERGHVGFAWPAGRPPIEDYYRFNSEHFSASLSDIEAFRDLYDGQVAWTDTLVGSLVAWLEERGLLEQTLVVVTSDHGEEIFERGQFDHGDTLFEEVTHVPLVVSAPGIVPEGRVVEGPVSLIDLPATILDLVGLADKHGQGSSLVPLWQEGADARSERVVFSLATGHGSEPLFAAWRGSFKLIRRETAEGTRESCYDLRLDPEESRPLPASACGGLRDLLDQHLADSAEIREALGAGSGAVDAETLERLRSLGYAQ